MAASATRSSFNGAPSLGQVNSNPPFGFKSSVGVKRDYGSLPSVAALQNPTLHNKVPEAMVNATARAPIFVRPFTRGFEKGYSEGDILFVRRKDERAGTAQNVVCNLPVLNYMLRTEKDGDNLKYDTLEKIVDEWNYFGILNNDMDTGSKWQRLLNVNVRGRSRVARLWQPQNPKDHLRKGDCLWLSFVQKTSRNGDRMVDPSGSRHPMAAGTQYIEVQATMDCCDAYKSALMSIPVGIVSQTSMRTPSAQSQALGHHVTEQCKSLERIEVLMRI